MANYRIHTADGIYIPVMQDEVETIQDWTEEDAYFLGEEGHFTHLERENSRTGKWTTVIAWDQNYAVWADASANIRF